MHGRDDDPHFGAPYIDADEWRDKPRRHRYIHGGFEKTETLFATPPISRCWARPT